MTDAACNGVRPRKKSVGVIDRFIPDDRTPQLSPRMSPDNTASMSAFNKLLYSSLIEKIHPDSLYISSTPTKSIQARPGTPASLEFLRRCRRPLKVLQIDEVPSDFYVHPVDWSARNSIAFAQTKGIVLLSPVSSASSNHLEDIAHPTSLAFDDSGDRLMIGNANGYLFEADVETDQIVRAECVTDGFLCVIRTANKGTVIGDHSGSITVIDTRMQKEAIKTHAHRMEICNIVLSPNRELLASGGNDFAVKIWDHRNLERPVSKYTDHNAAVRAIAWSPLNPSLIATGGGSNDRSLRLWSTDTGQLVSAVATGSQVCNLYWNAKRHVILSTHGFSQNTICLWKGSDASNITCFKIHTNRVLYMAASPNNEQVLTAAPKDHCYIWNMFASDAQLSERTMFSLR